MSDERIFDRYTDEQLEAGIVNALRAGDIAAVEAIMLVLAGQNPSRALEVFETMELGVRLHGLVPISGETPKEEK